MPIPSRRLGHLRYKTYLKGRYPLKDRTDPIPGLEYFRGDTVVLEVQVFDQDDTLVDLTDFEATVTVRCEEWSPSILFQATTTAEEDADVIAVTNPTGGVVTITLPTEFTSTLEPGPYVFDVQVVRSSDSFTATVLRDFFSIIRDITL